MIPQIQARSSGFIWEGRPPEIAEESRLEEDGTVRETEDGTIRTTPVE